MQIDETQTGRTHGAAEGALEPMQEKGLSLGMNQAAAHVSPPAAQGNGSDQESATIVPHSPTSLFEASVADVGVWLTNENLVGLQTPRVSAFLTLNQGRQAEIMPGTASVRVGPCFFDMVNAEDAVALLSAVKKAVRVGRRPKRGPAAVQPSPEPELAVVAGADV